MDVTLKRVSQAVTALFLPPSMKKTITKSRESCLKLVVNKYQKFKHKNLKPEVELR
jgi:hypothetical protein